MTILPPGLLTTVQLVGGLAASAKNALDIVKASSDHDLKAAVSELYDSVLDVKVRVLDLDEENRRLKADLERKAEVIGPEDPHGYFFFKDKPDQPLCPKCVQSQPANAVYLPKVYTYKSGAKSRTCIICRFEYFEDRASTQNRGVGGGGSWMS